jgi:hypothetical protein
VYNLVPPPGQPAEFGFAINGNLTVLKTVVRSGSDYGLTSITDNITRTELVGAVLTLWGEPSAPSHKPWACEEVHPEGEGEQYQCGISVNPTHKPFLTLPTSCTGPQTFLLSVNAWEDPSLVASTSFLSHNFDGEAVGFTGCEDLAFGPGIATSPDTTKADTPAGLTVEVKPPLGGLEEGEELGSSDIQDTTVTLPRGFVINPGQAAGLDACPPGHPGPGRYGDALTTPEEKEKGEEDNGPPSCPNASKVGTITARTPLIESAAEKEFKGDI